MDCSNGHLVANIDTVPPEHRHRYTQLPTDLNRSARRALDGRDQVTIDLTANTKLARFARTKAKRKRQAANASRKRNR